MLPLSMLIFVFSTTCVFNAQATAFDDANQRSCPLEMQSNGLGACGHLTSLTQTVNYDGFKKNHRVKNMNVIPWPAPKFIKKKEQALKNYMPQDLRSAVNKLLITEIRKISKMGTLYNISYDIYHNNETLTPSDFIFAFEEVRRMLRNVPGNENMFKSWTAPVAETICAGKVLGFGKEIFTYRRTLGEEGYSKEQCPNGTPKATVECRKNKFKDGSSSYDYRSIRLNSCKTQPKTDPEQRVNDSPINLPGLPIPSERDEKTLEETQNVPISSGNFPIISSDTAVLPEISYTFIKEKRKEILSFADAIKDKDKVFIPVSKLNYTFLMADEVIQAYREYYMINSRGIKKPTSLPSGIEIVFALEKLCSQTTENMDLETDHIHVKIEQVSAVSAAEDRMVRFSKSEGSETQISAFLPAEAIKKALADSPRETISLAYILFKDSTLFQTPNDKDFEFSQVLSVSVGDVQIRDLKNSLRYRMPRLQNTTGNNRIYATKCAYLNEETLKWQSDGCVTHAGTNPPKCTCNHLTNFALLVKIHDVPDPFSLKIFGIIGCSVSIAGLVMMLVCTIGLKSLRSLPTYQIHCHLGACLLLAYILFLAGVERTEYTGGCIAIAAVLQFLFLSAWGWMVVECITMYRKLVVNVFRSIGNCYVMKSALMVYSTAATVVAVNLVVAVGWFDRVRDDWVETGNRRVSSYVSERLCWLHDWSLIFGFLLPCGLALMINTVGGILVMKAITCDRAKIRTSRNKSVLQEAKTYLVRGSMISVLHGLTWATAIPLTVSADHLTNEIFGWCFSICNTLQGLLIFILFCVRNEKVRELWMTKKVTEGSSNSPQQTKRVHFLPATARIQ